MDEMTSRERIVAALRGQAVDRVPWSPFLAYVWEHFPPEVQAMGQPHFLQQVGADPLWRGSPCPVTLVLAEQARQESHDDADRVVTVLTTPVGTLHWSAQRSHEGNTLFLVEHPLRCQEDFKVQLWLEEHGRLQYDEAAVRQHLAGDGREGLSIGLLLPRAKSAFQTMVEHLVGTEQLAYALADFPDTVEQLLQTMIRRDEQAVRLAMRCDYEYYLTWEDSSTQNYSPSQYQRYVAPEIRQWCQILHQHGRKYLQHACGHVKDILHIMKSQGVTGIESLSPCPTGDISLKDARAILGADHAIIGGIEPTHFLNLSLRELDGYVEQVLHDGSGGPFILANSDSCPPGVTMEKFRRVGEIVRQSGPTSRPPSTPR
jgi:uroporphyrinogen-III decarboxylase